MLCMHAVLPTVLALQVIEALSAFIDSATYRCFLSKLHEVHCAPFSPVRFEYCVLGATELLNHYSIYSFRSCCGHRALQQSQAIIM